MYLGFGVLGNLFGGFYYKMFLLFCILKINKNIIVMFIFIVCVLYFEEWLSFRVDLYVGWMLYFGVYWSVFFIFKGINLSRIIIIW